MKNKIMSVLTGVLFSNKIHYCVGKAPSVAAKRDCESSESCVTES